MIGSKLVALSQIVLVCTHRKVRYKLNSDSFPLEQRNVKTACDCAYFILHSILLQKSFGQVGQIIEEPKESLTLKCNSWFLPDSGLRTEASC